MAFQGWRLGLTTIAAMNLVAFSSHAGSLNLDMRVDYDAATFRDSNRSDSNSFRLQTGRLDYQGEFQKDLNYRFRVRFNRDDRTTVRNDSLSDQVDYAYVKHKMADIFSLTLGKFDSELGGFDATTTAADIYAKSKNYEVFHDGSRWAGTTTGDQFTYAKAYVTGAKGTFSFADQEISVFTANNTEGSTVANQSRLLSGAVYKGAFLDNTLMPMVTYGNERANGGTGSTASNADSRYDYLSVGLKYQQPIWFVSLDQGIHKFGDVQLAGVPLNNVTIDQQSTVLHGAVNIGSDFAVRLMYDVTTQNGKPNVGREQRYTFNTASLAGEYRPHGQDDFRYHVAYTNQTTQLDTGNTTPTESHILVGARINADFLK